MPSSIKDKHKQRGHKSRTRQSWAATTEIAWEIKKTKIESSGTTTIWPKQH